MLDFLGIGSDQLIESLTETLQMLVTSAVIGAVIAMIIALILILTRTGGLMENRVYLQVLDTVPILFEAFHLLSFWCILDH